MMSYFFLLLPFFLLCACEGKIDNRGFNAESYKSGLITVGVDDQNTIQEKLGSPSTVAPFPDENGYRAWYYISKKTESIAFYSPTTLEQFVVVIHFDALGKVRSIKKVTGETEISPNSEKTESSGYEAGVLRDVFGNFGRNLGKPENNKSSS